MTRSPAQRSARKGRHTRDQWPDLELKVNVAEFELTLRMNMFDGGIRVKALTGSRHALVSLSRNGPPSNLGIIDREV